MEFKNKIKGVLGAIGREMDRWDEADRRSGARVQQELNPPHTPRLVAEDLLTVEGSVCHDYEPRGVMERARELRARETQARWAGRKS